MLVLPPNREDPSLLKEARGLLTAHADTLGVPRDRMPQPPRPAPARPSPATNAQGMAFDPYKVGGGALDDETFTCKHAPVYRYCSRVPPTAGGIPRYTCRSSVVRRGSLFLMAK